MIRRQHIIPLPGRITCSSFENVCSLLALAVLLVAGCRQSAVSPPPLSSAVIDPTFTTSTAFSSLAIQYDNGATGQNAIVESLGGGVGLLDYDLDGKLDLCCPGGGLIEAGKVSGKSTRLIRQLDSDHFVPVEQDAKIDAVRYYSHGCSIADYDHDGLPDVLITGYGGLTLWRNMGDGTFVDVTDSARMKDDRWSSSAAWGDVTGDGVLDLYVAHYANWSFENNPECRGRAGVVDVCPPRSFEGLDDVLYVGDGLGGFTDESLTAGLVPGGKGLGVIIADFDHDGDLDIYVANDTTPNFFYRNDGQGRFREEGVAAGVALDDMANANGSMGVTLITGDDASAPDLWVTNFENELFALYHNQKDGSFVYSSREAGLNRLGQLFVGFGCVSGDFDNDGDEDVAVSNGHVIYHPVNAPVRQQPLMMLNDGQEHFSRMVAREGSYFAGQYVGRGVATGDFNNDGKLDLVFVHSDAVATLIHNTTSHPSSTKFQRTEVDARDDNVRVRLIGIRSPRDGIGVQATLVTSKRKQGRQLYGGGSYLSTSHLRLHWGLGADERIQELAILWPSGRRSMIMEHDLRNSKNPVTGEFVVLEP